MLTQLTQMGSPCRRRGQAGQKTAGPRQPV